MLHLNGTRGEYQDMGENNLRVCEEVQYSRVFVAEGRRGGKKRKYICDLISDPDVGKHLNTTLNTQG